MCLIYSAPKHLVAPTQRPKLMDLWIDREIMLLLHVNQIMHSGRSHAEMANGMET